MNFSFSNSPPEDLIVLHHLEAHIKKKNVYKQQNERLKNRNK